MLQWQWDSKQPCLLVKAAASHWKHELVTNTNIMTKAKVSLKNFYLSACMKPVYTTWAS